MRKLLVGWALISVWFLSHASAGLVISKERSYFDGKRVYSKKENQDLVGRIERSVSSSEVEIHWLTCNGQFVYRDNEVADIDELLLEVDLVVGGVDSELYPGLSHFLQFGHRVLYHDEKGNFWVGTVERLFINVSTPPAVWEKLSKEVESLRECENLNAIIEVRWISFNGGSVEGKYQTRFMSIQSVERQVDSYQDLSPPMMVSKEVHGKVEEALVSSVFDGGTVEVIDPSFVTRWVMGSNVRYYQRSELQVPTILPGTDDPALELVEPVTSGS